MLPAFRQRVLIFVAVILGGWIWLGATGFVRAPDLSPGLAVVDSGGVPGVILACVMLVICGLPAMLGALLSSATGQRLAGPFVLGTCLCFVSIAGGNSSGFVWRSAQAGALPGSYGSLIVETLGWAAALIGLMGALNVLVPKVREALPGVLLDPGQRNQAEAEDTDAGQGVGFHYTHAGLLAGLVSVVIGGIGASLLVAVTDTGQLIGGLGISFLAAGLLSRLLIGQSNPTMVLLSPVVVAMAAYAWVWLGFADQAQLIGAWHQSDLLRAALPLPMDYLSAGTAAAAAGFGLGEVMVSEGEDSV